MHDERVVIQRAARRETNKMFLLSLVEVAPGFGRSFLVCVSVMCFFGPAPPYLPSWLVGWLCWLWLWLWLLWLWLWLWLFVVVVVGCGGGCVCRERVVMVVVVQTVRRPAVSVPEGGTMAFIAQSIGVQAKKKNCLFAKYTQQSNAPWRERFVCKCTASEEQYMQRGSNNKL